MSANKGRWLSAANGINNAFAGRDEEEDDGCHVDEGMCGDRQPGLRASYKNDGVWIEGAVG